jgi:hypothetical protein
LLALLVLLALLTLLALLALLARWLWPKPRPEALVDALCVGQGLIHPRPPLGQCLDQCLSRCLQNQAFSWEPGRCSEERVQHLPSLIQALVGA